MRYTDGMLPDRAFRKSLFKNSPQTLEGGGSPQQVAQPSSQTITNNPIADWAQPTATSLIGSQMQNAYNIDANGNILSSRGFTPFGGQTNTQGQFTGAPISQDQYNQQLNVAKLGVAGPSALQQQSYQGAANLQTPGQFGQATQMAGYGTASALGAGQNFENKATNPGSVQAYMNPYLQASLQPQLEEIQRQYGITGAQQAGQATQSGAFGGGRDAIMAAENQRNKNIAMNTAIGQGYNTAFNNAQNQMNTGAQLGLQGAQAGIQGAGQLSNIGTQQLAAQQGILGTQNQMGVQEQQNQQNIINQALQNYGNQQNYGTTQATNIMNLLRSTPTTQTQTQYAAPPSAVSQIAGLGTAGLAASKLMAGGGIAKVKKFDVGGSVENKLYELPNDKLTEEIRITPSQTIKNTGNAILKERQLGTTPPPAFAPGGIVAFAEGGESDVIPVEIPEDDYSSLGNPMGEFTMPGRIMANAKPSAMPVVAKKPMNVFEKAMEFVLPHEGGFVHHKNDRGGATNKGITQNTLSGYLGRKATIDDVKNLDTDTARDIYKTMFFDPIARKLDDPKAQMVAFNAAIASGPSYANKLIEKHKGNPYDMLNEHTNFMVNDIPKRDPSQKVFVPGWTNRQSDLGKYIQEFAEGGIAHFDKGGKTPDYTDYYRQEAESNNQKPTEIYPGYESDKAMYEGIAKIPGKLLKVNPYSIGTGIGESFKRAVNEPLDEQARQFRSASNRRAQANNPDKYVPPPVSVPTMIAPNKVASPMADLTDYYKQELAAKPLSTASNQPSVAPAKITTPSEENVPPSITPMGPSADLMQEPTQAPQDGNLSTRSTLQQMLMDRMAQQGKSAEQDKWMSLLSAGLGMMGGTSPYAAANIGQGAQAGIASQLAAKKNQMSEQNSILSGMLGLEKSQAMDKYHQAQMAQNLEIRNAEIDARLQNAQLSHQDRQDLLNERIRNNNALVEGNAAKLKESIESKRQNMLQNMEKQAQSQALAELKLNPMALMGKSAEEISSLTSPRVHDILKGNKRYRDIYQSVYEGYDPYAQSESPSIKVLKFDSKGNPVK